MLTCVGKVRLRPLLNNLCFKSGSLSIEPLIASHRLVGVLLRDLSGTLQIKLDLQVLTNELVKSLILQNVERRGLVMVENL